MRFELRENKGKFYVYDTKDEKVVGGGLAQKLAVERLVEAANKELDGK